MTEHVISIETIREKARKAHAAGRGRDEHQMNWHSPALATWQEEWDRCEAAKVGANTEALAA